MKSLIIDKDGSGCAAENLPALIPSLRANTCSVKSYHSRPFVFSYHVYRTNYRGPILHNSESLRSLGREPRNRRSSLCLRCSHRRICAWRICEYTFPETIELCVQIGIMGNNRREVVVPGFGVSRQIAVAVSPCTPRFLHTDVTAKSALQNI
jgi:hypothetical protein